MGSVVIFYVNIVVVKSVCIWCVNIVFIKFVFVRCVNIVFVKFAFKYNVAFMLLIIILLAGDVELNPGPRHSRQRRCRIMYANIRGLHRNIRDLMVASSHYDIFLCSEKLVSQMRHSSEVLIPGFKKPILFKRDAIPRARGMAAYIRNKYPASHKSCYECGCHETQVIKVSGRHNNFYLCSIYRNPDLDDAIFDCLLTTMAKIQGDDRKASFVFIGDFNAHHREWLNSVSPTDCHGVRALDFATESGCEQIINEATHNSGNCLDLVFTDSPGVITKTVGSPVGTSDHATLSLVIKAEQTVPDVSYSRRVYLKSQADAIGIENDLLHVNWSQIYNEDEPVVRLNECFCNIINRRIPSRMLNYRIKDKAWFNDDCRRAYREKQEAYHLWRRNRSDLTWNNYTHLRAVAQRVYASAEKEFNDATKETLSGTTQPHKWWSTLKSALFGMDSSVPPLLRPDGCVTHCPKEMATLLADVFDSKQSNEKLTMPHSCFPEAKLNSLAFRSREIKNLLLDLDAYGGVDPNGIFPLFLKKNAAYLAPKLAVIFRKLARRGSFCRCWRIGDITPLCKCGSGSSCPSDYRPISITPILSKVYERLLAKRLNAYAESNHLFPNSQFGFRKGLGACDALLTISSVVQKSLDSSHEVRLIGLDFSAAFDRVNHEALIFKLRQMGVGGAFLNIIIEFLASRKQRVAVDGHYSDYRNVISGVPQGSVLGPLLFILYTHDMWFGLENKLVAYADDATLLASVPSPDRRPDVAESLNRDLARISAWCKSWGMKLNARKTQSMVVSRSRTLAPLHPDLLIDNVPLTTCNCFKILGVILDSKFTFEKHIRSISSSVAQKIGILRKSFKIFGDQSILKNCFNSFILPCFEYCSPVWSSAADCHLKLLDKNLNAIKFLILDLRINLWHRRSISSLCMLYKIYHNVEHPMHSILPSLYLPPRITRNAANLNSLAFSFVRFNTTQFPRSFIPSVTRLWNDLPSHVVESLELQKFKLGSNAFLLNRLT